MFHGQNAGAAPSSQLRPHQTGTPRASASSASDARQARLADPRLAAEQHDAAAAAERRIEGGAQLADLALAIDHGNVGHARPLDRRVAWRRMDQANPRWPVAAVRPA